MKPPSAITRRYGPTESEGYQITRNNRRHQSRKKGKRTTSKGKLVDSDAWQKAEQLYSDLVFQTKMSFFGEPLTAQMIKMRLKKILRTCKQYYPAVLELGDKLLLDGKDFQARSSFVKGLSIAEEHSPGEETINAYYTVCEFLEEHFRFGMALEFYEKLLEIETDKARVYNRMCTSNAWLGEIDRAYENMQNALDLCDSNVRYYCNMGWVEMVRGNPEAAKTMLESSLALDENDETTISNYDICKILLDSEEMNNWWDHMLRPLDRDLLDRLEEEGNWDESDDLIRCRNEEKIEAFKFDLMRNPDYLPDKKYDIFFSLGYILEIIEEIEYDEYFAVEEIAIVSDNFKPIMHRFIFKTGDIDEKIFKGVYRALLKFYRFLAKRKLVSAEDYNELKEKMLELKPELMEKMRRYNEIRHNDDYTEEEKEDIREELFDGDHAWPF